MEAKYQKKQRKKHKGLGRCRNRGVDIVPESFNNQGIFDIFLCFLLIMLCDCGTKELVLFISEPYSIQIFPPFQVFFHSRHIEIRDLVKEIFVSEDEVLVLMILVLIVRIIWLRNGSALCVGFFSR